MNWTPGTNLEILIKIKHVSFMKMHLKISFVIWWPFCPGEEKLILPCPLSMEYQGMMNQVAIFKHKMLMGSFKFQQQQIISYCWNRHSDHVCPGVTVHRQVYNIRRTLVGNEIDDHSDVVGASPVGAAPTTSSFSTLHQASLDWTKPTARQDEKQLSLGIWCVLY